MNLNIDNDNIEQCRTIFIGILFTDLLLTTLGEIMNQFENNVNDSMLELTTNHNLQEYIVAISKNADVYANSFFMMLFIFTPLQHTSIGLCMYVYLFYIYLTSTSYVAEAWKGISRKPLKYPGEKYHRTIWIINWIIQLILLIIRPPTIQDTIYLLLIPKLMIHEAKSHNKNERKTK